MHITLTAMAFLSSYINPQTLFIFYTCISSLTEEFSAYTPHELQELRWMH